MASHNVSNKTLYGLAALRIGLGYIFFWAFLDKLFGLGFTTCKNAATGLIDAGCGQAWLYGGSPTKGFLSNATTGPLADFYHKLAGLWWVDWLFMVGLAFVGLGLLLGTWVRAAAVAGILMLLLMWSSLLWPTHAPGVDDHIIYGLALVVLLLGGWTHKLSLHGWWTRRKLAKKLPFLT